jgi:hypothetical protein
MRRDDDEKPVVIAKDEPRGEIIEAPDEPPVVARLVVEIRSDGSRTIARGALEDLQQGQRVAVKAEGTTPLALAVSLARAIFTLPSLGRSLFKSRGLLPGKKKR